MTMMPPSQQWPAPSHHYGPSWSSAPMMGYPHDMHQYSMSQMNTPTLAHMAQQQPQHQLQLDAGSKKPGQSGPWTADEDDVLLEGKRKGLGWGEIYSKHFPGKSANACRKRHERLKMRERTTNCSEEKIQRIREAYNSRETRARMWTIVAQGAKEPRWEEVEKICFQQGLKGMIGSRTRPASSRARASSDHSSSGGYGTSSGKDEYEEHDDSGIGLGVPCQSRRTSHNYSTSAPDLPSFGQVLHNSGGGYDYYDIERPSR